MPSSPGVPSPSPPSELDPMVAVWEAGLAVYRVHSERFAPVMFNPGYGRGRFHPFTDAQGRFVPTLYGADHRDGALSETVFRGVPMVGKLRGIRRKVLESIVLSVLAAKRNLQLIDLRGHGLRRIGLQRNQLLETEAESYPFTAAWAQALHRCNNAADGLIWVSRQFDTASVMVLFGDRLSSNELEVLREPISLYRGSGFDDVQQAAEEAGIAILE